MIAVTGASGYIARRVLDRLAGQGVPAVAFSRTPSPVSGAARWHAGADGVPTPGQLAGCSSVIHLAGRAHTRVANEGGRDLFDEANRVHALRCAQAARTAGVARFVFVSTLGVHGSWSAEPVRADSPIRANTPYARSKFAAERELQAMLAGGSMQLCIVRPPMVYGPGCPGNLPRLVRLVRSGVPLPFASARGVRSFIHVDGLASFLVRCAADGAPAGTFVIGDGSDWTLPDLVRAIASAQGRAARLIRFPLPMLRFAAAAAGRRREIESLTRPMQVDAGVAWEAFGWRPAIEPRQALKDTVLALGA
ncbi:MAG TPA: NAD-dependent epimerase/dehydratase family protein [Ramlibacter sp.]|uniref:NAD-dependent epimerase/dehydratase family protein n=1 Tax=Ramlibacter sp. TaxID=1917967 RepID=UPI002ED30693